MRGAVCQAVFGRAAFRFEIEGFMAVPETPLARPLATEPTLTPAGELALSDPERRAAFTAEDRAAAEVLIRHLFAPPAHRIDRMEHASAYRLAHGAIGGDIVDVYHFDNGDAAISVADIAGKGAQAAIHAALVKYGLRCFASEGLTPERVLRSLDRAYLENNAFERTESFASVFFAIVDKSRRAFTYASAGHEPVVLVAPHEKARVLEPTAPLVGVFDDQHHLFKQSLVDVVPGTMVVAATDGVTEARSPSGELFGLARLVAYVEEMRDQSMERVANDLLTRLEGFTAGGFRDDVAILAVRIGV
jgi:sigma-B regulation protein RsbU (phosphoserine phosphatase)